MNTKKIVMVSAAAALACSAFGCAGNSSGNSLIVGVAAEISGVFSPIYASGEYDMWINNLVYQKMMEYDDQSKLVPVLLAEEPKLAQDGNSVTFKLKEGLKFSDGSDLNANDVKFTFTLMADPEYKGELYDGSFSFIEGWEEYRTGSAEEVSGIVVQDPTTVTFKFCKPDIDAVNSIANFWIMSDAQYPYSKGNLGKYKTDTQNPVGSNGYKLNSFDKSAGASLVKNDQCFEKDEYKVDQIVVKSIEGSTELDVLQKGEINLLPEILEANIIGPASTDPNLTYNHYFRAGCGYMGFNCKQGPASDPAVRQALSYAIDRQGFVDAFYKYPEASEEVSKISLGYVPTLDWSPVSDSLGAYVTRQESLEGLQIYDFDLDKANQILDEAGWRRGENGIREKDGQKLEIRFLQLQDSAASDMLMPIIMKNWKEIGVDLKASLTEFNTIVTMLEDFENKDVSGWDAFFLGMQFLNTSNTIMNRQLGYSGSADDPVYLGENYARIVDEELNEALEQGKNTTDPAVSAEAYKRAAVRESELAPYVSVYGNQFFDLYSNKIKNLKTGPVCNWSQAMKGVTIE